MTKNSPNLVKDIKVTDSGSTGNPKQYKIKKENYTRHIIFKLMNIESNQKNETLHGE